MITAGGLDYVPVVPSTSVARFSLLAITWLAYAIRLVRLDGHAYRGDETFAVWFLRQDWVPLLAAIGRSEPHPPLYYALTKAWSGALGDHETVFRFFPPLVFGVLAVPLLGVIGWRLLPGPRGRLVGLTGAFLLAVNPFHLWYSQDARMYTQAMALALASTLCLIQLVEAPKRRWHWLIYGVVSAAAVLSHYAALPVILIQNGIVLFGQRPLLDVRRWLALQVATLALPAAWIAGNLPLLGRYVGNGDSPGLVDAIRRTATTFVIGRSVLPDWTTAAGLLGLALAVAGFGAIVVAAPRRRLASLTGAGVLAGFAVQWIASLRGPVFSDTYLLPAGGTYFLLWAGLLLVRSRWVTAISVTSLGLLLLANGAALRAYWFDPASAKGADWRSAAATIARDARLGDAIILNYPDPTFEYYYRGSIPVRLLPATTPVDRRQVETELSRLSSSNNRIWLVPVRAANWDAEGVVERWLDEHSNVLGTASFHQVRLVLFETANGLLQRATPINQRLGDRIALRASAIEPANCRARCSVSVTLIWSATPPPTSDYHVFIHLVDESGRLIAQSDGVPAEWRRPTTSWSAGELIVDPHEISGAFPIGRHRVIAGLYQADGRRLLTERGEDSIELATIQVEG